MKKVLVTGGTVFVSRYLAEYYIAKGYEVYVMNRNHRETVGRRAAGEGGPGIT